MACRWMWDKQIGRWLLPECMAVAHTWDLDSCTCPRPHNRLEALEARIDELERRLALSNGERA